MCLQFMVFRSYGDANSRLFSFFHSTVSLFQTIKAVIISTMQLLIQFSWSLWTPTEPPSVIYSMVTHYWKNGFLIFVLFAKSKFLDNLKWPLTWPFRYALRYIAKLPRPHSNVGMDFRPPFQEIVEIVFVCCNYLEHAINTQNGLPLLN